MVDQLAAETERGHQRNLAAVDVPPVQIMDLTDTKLFGLFQTEKLGHVIPFSTDGRPPPATEPNPNVGA
ncbi:hypothetical protein [Streptosporangium vulgare]